MTRSVAGFTLVEAAVVLTVAAFGLSVALPAYRDYKVREDVELVVRAAGSAQAVVDAFASANAGLPDSGAVALPFPTLAQVRSTTWAASGNHGTITVATRMGAKGGAGALDAKSIVLRAAYNPVTKRVDWACGGTPATTVQQRYLPDSCK